MFTNTFALFLVKFLQSKKSELNLSLEYSFTNESELCKKSAKNQTKSRSIRASMYNR